MKYLAAVLSLLIIYYASADASEISIPIHRMTQFDINNQEFGCRFSNLNLEIRSLDTWNSNRHCVLTKMEDLTSELYNEIVNKAGGLIIQLPQSFSNLSSDTKEKIYQIEQIMLSSSSSKIPIYFSQHNTHLDSIIEDINSMIGNKAGVKTATINDLAQLISSNGYQAITAGAVHTPNKKSKLPIIQGELVPNKKLKNSNSSRLSTIVITASNSPFRVNNQIFANPDVAILLIIAEYFSKMYSKPNTSPDYKILFLVSESGPLLNFLGTKKWLDDNQVQDVDFVLCLDTIIQPTYLDEENNLYMHVSKPPKEGTTINSFYKLLRETYNYHNKSIEGVHKKINLAENQLAWEHERFGIKKIPSFTLSSVKNYKSIARSSIFLKSRNELIDMLHLSAETIIESLVKYVFSINNHRLTTKISKVKKSTVESWIEVKSSLQNNDLKHAFEKYLTNVKVTVEKPDYRDPDFMLYNGSEAQLNIYNVKPAVFDLFLTILICSYLFVFYFALNNFPTIYKIFKSNF